MGIPQALIDEQGNVHSVKVAPRLGPGAVEISREDHKTYELSLPATYPDGTYKFQLSDDRPIGVLIPISDPRPTAHWSYQGQSGPVVVIEAAEGDRVANVSLIRDDGQSGPVRLELFGKNIIANFDNQGQATFSLDTSQPRRKQRSVDLAPVLRITNQLEIVVLSDLL